MEIYNLMLSVVVEFRSLTAFVLGGYVLQVN